MQSAPGDYRVAWTTLAASQPCGGCDFGAIPAGRRALRFEKGRGLQRLSGRWFHGYACLARLAELSAVEEDEIRPGRGEAFRELARWAGEQERLRRAAGRL